MIQEDNNSQDGNYDDDPDLDDEDDQEDEDELDKDQADQNDLESVDSDSPVVVHEQKGPKFEDVDLTGQGNGGPEKDVQGPSDMDSSRARAQPPPRVGLFEGFQVSPGPELPEVSEVPVPKRNRSSLVQKLENAR